MSIVPGVAFPSLSTFTGTVTTFPSFSTVTVPSVGAGTFGTIALPSSPVFDSCGFPFPSTIVTVASFTGSVPFVTLIFTSRTAVSSIVSGFAVPSSSTDTITALSA